MKHHFNRRYFYTYSSWLWHEISRKLVNKSTIFLFLTVAFSGFFLFHTSLPGNLSQVPLSISVWWVNTLGIENVNDVIVKRGITTVISSLTLIISLLSAIYVFTHREQKNVSPSASTDNHKNGLVILVISLMIFNVVFGSSIVMEYNGLLSSSSYVESLQITKSLYSRIVVLCICLGILIYFIDQIIRYLFKTISIDSMLADSVNSTEKYIDLLKYTHRDKKFEGFLDERYRKFHYSLESVFQNLNFAAENNMNKEFEENIEKFKKSFRKLDQNIEKYNIRNVSTYLLREDGVKFTNAYNSALRSNLSLISMLLKKNQYTKAKKAVSLYFSMYLESEEKLKKIFKISLHDFLDIIDTDDERQLIIFSDGLKEISKEHTLITYKFLLMKLINKNRIKNLTNLVYASDEYKGNKFLERSQLVILLQNLIKSIEISNYAITGFMVKFLVTNFSGKDINRGLVSLKRNRYAFSSVLEVDEEIEGINENSIYAIKINDETFDYCFKKAYILLFSQHLYSLKNNLWYTKNSSEVGREIMLGTEFKDCSYCEYMVKKIERASGQYGLLFFEDYFVMGEVYSELNISPPNSKEDMNIPQIFGLLVNKLFK